MRIKQKEHQTGKAHVILHNRHPFRKEAATEEERDEWVFKNLTKEQLKSSGIIQ